VVSAATAHLEVRATLSETAVAPGARISIAVDITPKAKMHVYAPGGQYRPVAIRIDPQPFVRAHDVVYPKPEDYFFEPLNEHAQVYSAPFRLVQDITVAEASDQKTPPRPPARLTLKAVLEYQACDDKLCYLPVSIPLQWTIKVAR
jgi:DsbC/DsbD-like thiol-disulfide interchange protein